MTRRMTDASLRFNERRRREDEAPRLHERLPALATLRLEVEERRSGSVSTETKHVRLVVVDSAPALFVLPCGDSSCRDGGHDLTDGVLRSLAAGKTRFELEDGCLGNVGSSTCGRVLRVVGLATYH
ncbi:MAG: hypothetical protein HY908_36560 [Myxococcales bacterium]|nr:hypothetical protein [Myxococcales bacterium]